MVSDNAAMALDDYIAKSKIGKGGRGGNRGGGRSRGKKVVLDVELSGFRFECHSGSGRNRNPRFE